MIILFYISIGVIFSFLVFLTLFSINNEKIFSLKDYICIMFLYPFFIKHLVNQFYE